MILRVSIGSVCMDNGLVRFQPHFLMMYLGSHRWSGEDTECFFFNDLYDDLFCLKVFLRLSFIHY